MKHVIFLMLAFSITAHAEIKGQRIADFNVDNATLKTCLEQIERQTGLGFIYNSRELDNVNGISLHVKDADVSYVLERVLHNTGYGYRVVDGVIALVKEPAPALSAREERAVQAPAERIITGAVKDTGGAPLPGVSVVVKGTTNGVATDQSGRFSITVDRGTDVVLLFSYVGMVGKEVRVGNQSVIGVTLEENRTDINQVMVVAYGTQLKRDVTGSVAKISTFDAEKSQVGNVMTGLQGRVPGLVVRKLDGSPGATPDFRIRGYQGNNLNNSALIVVDGIVIDGKDNFNLSSIAPQDIESIDILKDAASSAMYGSRGAMGVIQITTKKGQLNRKPVVNLSAYYGMVQSPMNYRMMNNQEYEMIFNEGRNNRIDYINDFIAGGGSLTPALEQEINRYRNEMANLNMGNEYIDWISELIPKRAYKSDVFVSLNGGDAKTTYYFSAGRNSEESSIGKGKFTRLSTKLALTNQTYSWLKVSANLGLSQSTNKGVISSMTTLNAATVRPDTPYEPKYNDDGTWGYYFGSQQHPLLVMKDNDNKDVWTSITGTFKADVNLLPGLVWTSSLNGTMSRNKKEAYYSPQSYNGRSVNGNYDTSGSEGHVITSNTFLNYNLTAGKWGIGATFGYEYTENKYEGYGYGIVGFAGIEGLEWAGNGSSFAEWSNYQYLNRKRIDRSESVFLRANAAFLDRYLLSVSMRRDGTSKLPRSTRYSNFPAVSAGWIISDESFMSGQRVFNLLKLRASYGITGSIANLAMTDTFDYLQSNTYFNSPALRLSNTMGNPFLRWEKTKQFDAGLEMDMFSNRLSITLEWYYKYTNDMLTSEDLPSTTGGFTTRRVNSGTNRNRGFDIGASYRDRFGDGFSYSVGLNMNINRSKILELPTDPFNYSAGYYGGGNSPRPRLTVGQPFGSLLMYQALGIDENGDVIYYDKDGSGTITASDLMVVNVLQNKFTGGLNASISWKGLSLYGQFSFTYGGKIYNADEHFPRTAEIGYNGAMSNFASYLLDRWTPENKNSRYPRYIVGAHGPQNEPGWNNKHSTLYLFDASFFKLSKLTLSYDLPERWVSRISMNNCRVYLSGENVFTIKNKNLNIPDPEAALNSGIAQKAIPSPRSFMVGLDITF